MPPQRLVCHREGVPASSLLHLLSRHISFSGFAVVQEPAGLVLARDCSAGARDVVKGLVHLLVLTSEPFPGQRITHPLYSFCWCAAHLSCHPSEAVWSCVSCIPALCSCPQLSPHQECHRLLGGAGRCQGMGEIPQSRRAPPPLRLTDRASSSGDLRNTSGRLLLILNISLSS